MGNNTININDIKTGSANIKNDTCQIGKISESRKFQRLKARVEAVDRILWR